MVLVASVAGAQDGPPPATNIQPLQQAADAAAAQVIRQKQIHETARQRAWTLARQLDMAQQYLATTKARVETAEKESAPQQLAESKLAYQRAAKAADRIQRQQAVAVERLHQTLSQLQTAKGHHEAKLRTAQSALAKKGLFISFAHEIAPILTRRCFSCHASQVAKGGIDLSSYAATIRSGKRGNIVVPGNADSSTLYTAVADESMPQEDTPLTRQEINLIKQWIDRGAALDAGIEPEDQLTEIIPRKVQPEPPDLYHVPVPITAIAFSPAGQLLATGGYHEVILWNSNNGRLVRRVIDVAQQICGIDFAPDGNTMAVASGAPSEIGETSLFRVADGTKLRTLITSTGMMHTVRFSPDGQLLATGGHDTLIHIFTPSDGARHFRIADHFRTVTDIAWSHDGNRLASSSLDRNTKVFDVTTGLQLSNFQKASESNFQGMVYGVDFSTDGKWVVSCGNDQQLRISNASDGKLVREISGFAASVTALIVDGNGKVFSASADHSVRLHALEDGQQLRTFVGHHDWVYAIDIHPATQRLATASYDGEVRIWNIDSGKSLLSFTAAPGWNPKN